MDGALTNSVEIWTSRQSAFPRSDITINVKAKPYSFVGVMVCEVARFRIKAISRNLTVNLQAVDKRVRSLKADHDILQADVVHELRSYDSAPDPSIYPWFR